MLFYGQLVCALLLDLTFGDPRFIPHPVRYIGWLCERFEKWTRYLFKAFSLRLSGILSFFLVLATTLVTTWLFLQALNTIGYTVMVAGAILLLYFSLAVGDLIHHSRKVINDLRRADVESARSSVSMMVGRDTDGLDQFSIARACIESVAENLVDGITAPIFWSLFISLFAGLFNADPLIFAVFGAVGYKAINTMDSMYGYKNERFLKFGWCAARVDDAANFVPARLSGFCVVAAAFILRYNYRAALQVFLTDRLKSSSPNSGHTEAAVAGAIGVQLGGEAAYFGKAQVKPIIGAQMKIPEYEDIIKTNYLVLATTFVFLGVGICVHLLLTTFVQ